VIIAEDDSCTNPPPKIKEKIKDKNDEENP
jgi:hypothetical protein